MKKDNIYNYINKPKNINKNEYNNIKNKTQNKTQNNFQLSISNLSKLTISLLTCFFIIFFSLSTLSYAKVTAVSVVEIKNNKVRLSTELTSDKVLKFANKPKTVHVLINKNKYRLFKTKAKTNSKKVGTYKSKYYKPTSKQSKQIINKLNKNVKLEIKTRRNKIIRINSKLTSINNTPVNNPTNPNNPNVPNNNPNTPPSQPLFTPVGKQLTGTEAWESVKKYFLNSEFSDCFAGRWPTCQVENRYEHGSNFEFEYHRCTPVSGSDVNNYSNYQVTGVSQNADGSWVIEYTTNNGDSFYHWEVGLNGIVNGYYAYQGKVTENMSNYYYRQPALLGRCYL